MKRPESRSFEATYPTKRAREAADAVIDALPLEASMAEHLRLWELTYLEAGGIVKAPWVTI
jgi:hypothetical protein